MQEIIMESRHLGPCRPRHDLFLSFLLGCLLLSGGLGAQKGDEVAQARRHLEEGRAQEAHDLLVPAFKSGNREPARLRILGKASMALGRPEEAIRFFDAVVKAGNPRGQDHANLAWSRFELARVQPETSGRGILKAAYLDAAEAARKGVEADPKNLMAWQFLTAAYENAGENEKAAEVFETGLKALGEKGGILRKAYATFLGRMGKTEDAIAELERILSKDQEDQDTRLAQARIWADAGRLDRARVLFRSILKNKPDHIPTYEEIYRRYNPAEKRQKGIALLKEVVIAHPKNLWALGYLGNFYSLVENYSEAEAVYKQCLQIKPDYAWAHRILGELYRNQTLAPGSSQLRDPVIKRQLYLKAVKAYLRYYDYAFAQKNVDRNTAQTVSSLLVDLSRTALNPVEAYKGVKIMVGHFPDMVELHHAQGLICWDLGKFKEAEAAMLKAISLCPDGEEWSRGQFTNNLGLVYEGWNKYSKARKQFEAAAKMTGPGRLNGLENLGKLAYKLGNPKKALAYFKAVLDEDSGRSDSMFYYHLCRRWIQRETYFRRR